MKKGFLTVILAAFFSAAAASDIGIFTSFGVSYGSVAAPHDMADNNVGVYDTMVFDAAAGVEIVKWADVYAGGSFLFFNNRAEDGEQHYTFYPLFGGVRVNIFPEWAVFPAVMAEAGAAAANRHYWNGYEYADRPWPAFYYNFGISLCLNVTEKGVLGLNVERPAFSGYGGGEIHVLKAGFSWKAVY